MMNKQDRTACITASSTKHDGPNVGEEKSRRKGINKKLKLAMNSFKEYNKASEGDENRKSLDQEFGKSTDQECIQINLINLSPKEKKEDNFGFQDEELNLFKKMSQKQGDYNKLKTPKLSKKASTQSEKDKAYHRDFLLAEGSFGKVYQVTKNKTGEKFAMKVLSSYFLKKYNKSHEAYIERHVLSTCQHKNIVKFHKCYLSGDSLCFLLDLCENGSLSDYLERQKTVNHEVIKFISASVLNALEYLNSKNVVHRDIKPCNILLDKDFNVKLADFGTAKIFECKDSRVTRALQKRAKREESRSNSPKKNSFVGTNEYISPEVLLGHAPSCAIDLWSLGVLIYNMYVGSTPFSSDNEMDTYELICHGKFQKHDKIPEDAWDLIKALLQVDPRRRIGCTEIMNEINYSKIKGHAFFKDLDFDNLKMKLSEEKDVSETNDCSDQESFEEESVKRPALNSFAVPCNMEDDEDFYQNCFTDQINVVNKPRPYESFNIIPSIEDSPSSLLSFLVDDHFKNQQRKHSLKCTQTESIPVLFDEESDVETVINS